MGDVILTFAQGRNGQRYGTDSEVEIAAKGLRLDQMPQVLMGGGNQANVNETIADVPHASKLFLFQNLEQFGLNVRINVANFVEKHGAPMGDLEQPGLDVDRPGERSFLMAKQLGFEELSSQSSAVEVDERFLSARAILMKPRGENSLARPRFPLNQNRALTVRDFCGGLGQPLDSGAFSQEGIEYDTATTSVVGSLLLLIARVLEHFVNDHQERSGFHRFRETLLCSASNERDSQFHGTITGQHNERNCGFEFLKAGDKFECGSVGQTKIENGDVGTSRTKTSESTGDVFRLFDDESVRREVSGIGTPQIFVVVDQ